MYNFKNTITKSTICTYNCKNNTDKDYSCTAWIREYLLRNNLIKEITEDNKKRRKKALKNIAQMQYRQHTFKYYLIRLGKDKSIQ